MLPPMQTRNSAMSCAGFVEEMVLAGARDARAGTHPEWASRRPKGLGYRILLGEESGRCVTVNLLVITI